MSFPRKRKHQETPMPPRVQGDPTATLRSRIPPDKTFHFSRRIKPKMDDHDMKEPAPAEDSCTTGLRRFQKRNRLKAQGYSKLNDKDLEEAKPLLGEETIINAASTTNDAGLSDFERIIPLGRLDKCPKSSVGSTKQKLKKKKKKKGFLGISRTSRAPEDPETHLAKKAEANHLKTSFHGSHTTQTRDCDSSLGATSTLSSPQNLFRTVVAPSSGGAKRKTREQTLPSPDKRTGGIMHLPQVISVLNPSTDEINLQVEEPAVAVARESSPKTFQDKSEAPVAISDLPKDNEEKPKQREAAPNVSSKAPVATKQNNKILADKTDTMEHAEPKSQPLPVLEKPPLDSSSVGHESHTNLDATKNDEEEKNQHTSHDSKRKPSREESTSLASADQSSTSLLTKANLIAHSKGEAAAAEEPTHNIELEEDDPDIPQPTLWRGETGFSTQIMGVSPSKECDKMANTVDHDSRLDDPVERPSKEAPPPSRSDRLPSEQVLRDLRYCGFPIPRRLIENFNAVAREEALAKASRKNLGTTGSSNPTGDRSPKKRNQNTRRQHPRLENHPSRHTTSALENVIENALASQRRSAKRNVDNMAQGYASKRPKALHSIEAPKSAFVRRTRPARPRTETIGNSDDFKRMVRIPFESANRKPSVPSSAKLLSHNPKGNGCGNAEDSSDWSADWDNLSIDSTPSVKENASFFEDCPTDEKRLARKKRNDEEKSLKPRNAKQQSKPAAPSTSLPKATCACDNLETTEKSHPSPPSPPRKAPKDPPRNSCPTSPGAKSACDVSESSENSHAMLPDQPRQVAILHSRSNASGGRKKPSAILYQSSFRLVLFLFFIYAVLWTRYSPGSSVVFRHNWSIINKIDPGRLEKQKRMLHRIWFSENPNLSLLESSKMQNSTMM